MSSAIGGRSVNIGAAPDRSAAQTTQSIKNEQSRFQEEFDKLTPEEQNLVILGGAFDKYPQGATPEGLFARRELRTQQANDFISAPSGANVDRRQAAARVAQLDQIIAQAQAGLDQNNKDRYALESQGLNIYAGSPLDLAFSNKTREFQSVIYQAQAEKQGIGLQTDTQVRKSLFDNFKVITDKRGGTGLNRGVFDPSGRLGLDKATTEQIRKQQLQVADLDTAIANRDKIIANAEKTNNIRVKFANQGENSGRRAHRAINSQDRLGNVNLVGKTVDFGEKEFFTDQLLVNDYGKIDTISSPEFAAINAQAIAEKKSTTQYIQDEFDKARTNRNYEPFQGVLGRSVPFSQRFSSNIKSGTNSRGVSDLEREQYLNTKSAQLQGTKRLEKDLTGLNQARIVKFQDSTREVGGVNGAYYTKGGAGYATQRQASLYEALQTLNRISGLPQFNGDRGADTVGKARLGALNKIQNERIQRQGQESSKLQVKKDFDKELAAIQASDLNQKDKKAAIFAAARKRDAGLQGTKTTNIQFEQSRAGFAAARTNIVSGATVKSVQSIIEEGRRRRNLINYV